MDPSDLYIRIGRRRTATGVFPLVVAYFDGRRISARLSLRLPDRELLVPAGYEAELRSALLNALPWSQPEFLPPTPRNLLLHLEAPELFALPWEAIRQFPEFAVFQNIVRFFPRSAPQLAFPLNLPIDVLLADVAPDAEPTMPHLRALKYFDATTLSPASPRKVGNLLDSMNFEVVHLLGQAIWKEGEGVLVAQRGGEVLSSKELARHLRRSRTRFLVLDGGTQYAPMLDLAHRLQAAGGPTTLVGGLAPADRERDLDQLYYHIVHDEPLDTWRASAPAALFAADGGTDILRISPLAPRLLDDVESRVKKLQDMRKVLDAQLGMTTARGSEAIQERIGALDEAMHDLNAARQHVWNFQRESGGLVPLSIGAESLRLSDRAIAETDPQTRRVVNAWFAEDERTLLGHQTLGLARLYTFKLQIGPASAKSIVKRAQPLNEEALERFYSVEGLQLRVVLFSSDFDLLETEKTLRLPRPPEESEELSFALRTPKEEGRASLRACVYFRRNLLQSLHVHAWITTTAGRLHRVGNEAIVDFALTSSFVDLEELPDRAVCFASNQDNSTNSFFVHGENLTRKINLENLAGGVADARRMLTKVCAGDDLEKPRYQFGADNLGTTAKFIESTIALARMGSSLYVNFVTRGQDRKFEDDLQTALAKPSTIQIAVTREASHVFPWALVYEKRLVRGNNTVCPQFIADLKAGAPLDAQKCLVNGCQDANPNVVCPSAFWGFRHIVEQPLSIEEPAGAGASNIVLTIPRTNPVTCLVGVSQELPYVGDHKTELTAIGGVTIDYKDSKVDIGTGLQRRDVSIVYFYCHGGRTSSQAWLGVGKKEQLFPADLHGWKVDWPTVHPLVFINGCNTVAITPDDLLPFNRMLAWSRAAGVVGTEIQIPEDLAREFGRGFLVAFLAGQTAGAAIRALRLKLLQKYNPLGLAYTLYCSADLRLD